MRGHALGGEPRLPAPDAPFKDPLTRRMIAAVPSPSAGGQNDLGPLGMLLGAVSIGHQRLQASTVGGRYLDGDPFALPADIGLP